MMDGSFGGLDWPPSQEIDHNRNASANTQTIQQILLRVASQLDVFVDSGELSRYSCLYTLHLPPSPGDRCSCHVASALHGQFLVVESRGPAQTEWYFYTALENTPRYEGNMHDQAPLVPNLEPDTDHMGLS